MSFFKGYLKERWKRLLMLLLFVCIFAVSFWFYRLPVRAVMYPCALCLLFGAVFAAYDCPAFKPWLRKAYVVIALLICASTVFIKQHSILDTLAGLILCLPFYWVVYGFHSKRRAKA